MRVDLGGGYVREGDRVLYRDIPMPGVDLSSFAALAPGWARDGARAYREAQMLRAADPLTFEVVNALFAKDCARVWTVFGAVAGADAATFTADELTCDEHGERLHCFARDASQVYSWHRLQQSPAKVRGAEPATFRTLTASFGCDVRSVFFEHKRLKRASPTSWRYVGNSYSTDGERAFYQGSAIEGAHARALEAVPGTGSDAWDGTAFFDCGERDAWHYLTKFRKWTVVVGKVVSGGCLGTPVTHPLERGPGIEFHVEVRDVLQAGEGSDVPSHFPVRHVFSRMKPDHWVGSTRLWFLDPQLGALAWDTFWPLEKRSLAERLVELAR